MVSSLFLFSTHNLFREIACLSLGLFSFTAASCIEAGPGCYHNATNEAVLSGEVKGVGDSSFVLYITESLVGSVVRQAQVRSTVVRQGKFCFRFELTGLSALHFSQESLSFDLNVAGESTVYLDRGDSLHMVIPHVKNLRASDVEFHGDGVERQSLLRELGKVYQQHLLEQQPTTFEGRLQHSMQLNENVSNLLVRLKSSVSREFWNHVYASRKEGYYGSMVSHFLKSRMAGERERKELYRKYIDRILTDPEDAISIIARQGYVRTLMHLALLDYLVKNDLPFNHILGRDVRKTYSIMAEAYSDHPALEVMLARFLLNVIKIEGWTPDTAWAVAHFLEHFPTGAYRELVLDLQNKFTRTLKDDFSYNFTLFDTLDREVRLDRFAGKVLFIDVVFNGCVGCYLSRRNIEELEAEFAEEDIVFISISIDKTLETFKSGIGRFSSSKSLPLYTGGTGSNHPFIDQFEIGAYPTILLIGKNADIITRRTGLQPPKGEKEIRHLMYETLLQ